MKDSKSCPRGTKNIGGRCVRKVSPQVRQPKLDLNLEQFIGTEQYHRHGLMRNFVYTDGIKYLADKTGSYWLIDVVASYQLRHRNKPFQLWKIKVNKEDNSAVVTAREDKGEKPFVRQKIEYTDFPLEEFEFYVADGVILLKSEY